MTVDAFKRFSAHSFHHPALAFTFDWSRAGIARSTIEAFGPKLVSAFERMGALEGGALANSDEQRRVGHYWLRSPELAPEAALRSEIEATVARVLELAERVRSGAIAPPSGGRFTEAVVVGIGGSALGPQLLIDALAGADAPVTVHFADNTDPDGFDRLIARLGANLARTLVVVISKSGGTKETRNGMLELENAFRLQGLEFARHAIAITQAGSELDSRAEAAGFVARLPMWDWVGGRTSVTSAVGLFPSALAGIDVTALLAGAAEMDRATRATDVFVNPAALLACIWYALGDGNGRRAVVGVHIAHETPELAHQVAPRRPGREAHLRDPLGQLHPDEETVGQPISQGHVVTKMHPLPLTERPGLNLPRVRPMGRHGQSSIPAPNGAGAPVHRHGALRGPSPADRHRRLRGRLRRRVRVV